MKKDVRNLGASLRTREIPAMTPGEAALVVLMDRYLAGLLDPFVTLLEVDKLMYFMQEAGEPVRLRHIAGPNGPYAVNLRHALRAVEGYYVSGCEDAGAAPDKILQLVPGAVPTARVSLEALPEYRARCEKVVHLVEGFESPFGLELLATAHWIVTRDHPVGDGDLIEHVYAWAKRKRQFSARQIRLARRVLAERGWMASAGA
jgi:hypothetical protein